MGFNTWPGKTKLVGRSDKGICGDNEIILEKQKK